mmetsp:Transcript_16530/g.29449  ORF Transcript_16530/g.29449 Transcript_16530/m.29449 type:complete len:110 (+) Transcript_16530:6691-7020(+)
MHGATTIYGSGQAAPNVHLFDNCSQRSIIYCNMNPKPEFLLESPKRNLLLGMIAGMQVSAPQNLCAGQSTRKQKKIDSLCISTWSLNIKAKLLIVQLHVQPPPHLTTSV